MPANKQPANKQPANKQPKLRIPRTFFSGSGRRTRKPKPLPKSEEFKTALEISIKIYKTEDLLTLALRRLGKIDKRVPDYFKQKLTLPQVIEKEILWFAKNDPLFLFDIDTGKLKKPERIKNQLENLIVFAKGSFYSPNIKKTTTTV